MFMPIIDSFVRAMLAIMAIMYIVHAVVHLPRVQGPPVTANSIRGGRESRKPSL